MSKFDAEEKEILQAFESGKLQRSKNAKDLIEQHKTVAAATFKKDARSTGAVIELAQEDKSEQNS